MSYQKMSEKKDKLIPGYKPLTDFVVSKNVYNGLKKLNKKEKGAEWEIYKYEYPEGSNQHIGYKKLVKEIDDSDAFYKTLIRELDITNKARHPCTIELISFDLSDNNHPNVVVKYYEKGSLSSLFKKTNYLTDLDNTNRYILMYGIARGVRYLHKLKIFHRDLKPDNIVIDEEFFSHVADFGYSKITEDDKEMSNSIGTLIYAAPEITKGVKYSFPADVFALGLIFYQIIEKKFHIQVKDEKKAYQRFLLKLSQGQKLEVKNHDNLADLINQMIDYDPENRPKIDEVCSVLEKEENWFKGVDKEKFLEYKKMIDDYEQEQITILNQAKVFIQDDASSLTQQIKKIKNEEKAGKTKEEGAGKTKSKNKKGKKESTPKPTIPKSTKYKEAQVLLNYCMNSNNEAEFALGSIFYTGYKGIPKDYVNAYYYFNESYLHGNPQAKTFMNNIYQEILENEQINNNTIILYDYDKEDNNENEIYNKLTNKKSQLIYGMIKESLNEKEEAYLYYMKSAKQGSKEAKGRLGSLLRKMKYYGEETEKLLKESITEDENYELDANERKIAQLNLGLLKLDIAKTILKTREEKGRAKAQAQAAQSKSPDEDKDEDKDEGENKEIPEVQEEDPTEKEAEDQKIAELVDEAIPIFEELLKEEHPDAALLLGTCYQLKNDLEKAQEYYKISSNQYSNESAEKLLQFYKDKKQKKK